MTNLSYLLVSDNRCVIIRDLLVNVVFTWVMCILPTFEITLMVVNVQYWLDIVEFIWILSTIPINWISPVTYISIYMYIIIYIYIYKYIIYGTINK